MALNVQRTTGRSSTYKFDRGGVPTDFGPFSGEIMNNVDPTRSGRVQVYIEQFAGNDKHNKSLWRTVSYCPPMAGATPKSSSSAGVGSYGSTNNQQSYGQAVTSPDIGVNVLCFFIGGDPDQGYYVGCIPAQGITHMTPAIGATPNAVTQNENQKTYFAKAPRLPATEINNAEQNTEINENPKYFNQPKPVHSYVAAVSFQQGLTNDPVRGSISSSSQRESPSNVHGMSTPGRPIYQGSLDDKTIQQQVSSGSVKPQDVNVIGRRGGHSIVMDDGDVSGKNALVRFRTAKGHQITMSDDANSLYITHANGQIWMEFGQEGTLDVYSTNSINFRTQGDMNFHADQDINIFAKNKINMKSIKGTTLQSEGKMDIATQGGLVLYSEAAIGVKSDGSLALQSSGGSWKASGSLAFEGGTIDLNGGSTQSVETPTGLTTYTMPDVAFQASTGWDVSSDKLESIVTRAPAHEPWPYHNQGTPVKVSLAPGQPGSPPGAPTVPPGTTITKTN
jgi:hypothetical protein